MRLSTLPSSCIIDTMESLNSSFLNPSTWSKSNFLQLQNSGETISLIIIYDNLLALVAILALGVVTVSHGTLWDKPDPLYHLWYKRPQGDASQGGQKETESRDIAHKLEALVSNIRILCLWQYLTIAGRTKTW